MFIMTSSAWTSSFGMLSVSVGFPVYSTLTADNKSRTFCAKNT